MSFGYYDSDWIDPPDPDYEGETGEIVIEFNRDIFEVDDEEVTFKDTSKFVDFYDEEYDSYVTDGGSIEEYVWEALEDKWPTIDGLYMLSGWVSIPYVIWVPTRKPRYEEDYEAPEAEIDGKPVAGEIKIEPVE